MTLVPLCRMLLLAFALLLPGIARANDVIHIGETPFISGGAFFIARARGYFQKMGIDVDVAIFNDGALAIPAIVSGQLDVTAVTAAAGLFNSIAKGAPMVIFLDRSSNGMGHGGTAISVATPLFQSGLKTAADFAQLKGKTIGVTALGSINQYEAARALMLAGLDPRKDVIWNIGAAQPDLVKMLGRNLVDATDLGYQFANFAAQQKAGMVVADANSIDPDSQVAVYAARKDFIASHRDVLVRFAMAILQGGKDFNATASAPDQHPEIMAILAHEFASGKTEILKSYAPYWTYAAEDGAPKMASILRMQDFWADYFHLVAQKTSAANLFDMSIAAEARARLDREHPFDK